MKRAPIKKPAQQPTSRTANEILNGQVEIYSTFKPLFNNNKIFYIPFTVAPVINKRYYFSDFPEIDKKLIRGIEFISDAFYIPTIEINGVAYNVIAQADSIRVQATFCDVNNEPLIYRAPLPSFYKSATIANRQSLELKDYADLHVDCGKSYFEFCNVAFVTVFPMVIPLKFIW